MHHDEMKFADKILLSCVATREEDGKDKMRTKKTADLRQRSKGTDTRSVKG